MHTLSPEAKAGSRGCGGWLDHLQNANRRASEGRYAFSASEARAPWQREHGTEQRRRPGPRRRPQRPPPRRRGTPSGKTQRLMSCRATSAEHTITNQATGRRQDLEHAILEEVRRAIVGAGANACKGMLLRTGTGEVQHLSTKQLRVQGAIRSDGVEVHTRCLAMRTFRTV